ncbi:hypothetical protein [Sphingobium yanoikuyae]|uniref:hypothetical protein n=1 Tax=Sphingobium yanoikuyae TaxID=13690 RepID=UPI003014150B
MDETVADATVGSFAVLSRNINLREDLERAAVGGDDADYAAGTKGLAAVFKDAAATATSQWRGRSNRRDPIGGVRLDFVRRITVADALPFEDSAVDHAETKPS